MSTTAPRRGSSARQLRNNLRWTHLALGGVSAFVLYVPLVSDELARFVLGFVVFPLLSLTGLWIWQQTNVRRMTARVSSRLRGGSASPAKEAAPAPGSVE
jgi:hypothetical protein